jgi:hypothetical protein
VDDLVGGGGSDTADHLGRGAVTAANVKLGKRRNMEIYGTINKPFWDDKPVAVIGGGLSLQDFNYEALRGAHVLAVKHSIFDIPWADAGFGLDMPKYKDWRDKLAHVQSRVYWAVPEDQLQRTGPPPSRNVTFLKRMDGQQLSDDPGVIYGGGTSGFGAMQICIHKRAKQIVLFGFDYDGSSHAPSEKRRAQDAANWAAWAEHFRVFVPYLTKHGISVVNASPMSAITCFQKVALQDAVAICK